MRDNQLGGYEPPEAKQQPVPEDVHPSAQAQEIHNLQEQGIELGDQKLQIGDQISVRRSDGTVESDWVLRSFGVNKVVADKTTPEGELLRKVYTMDQFRAEQQDLPALAPEAEPSHTPPKFIRDQLRKDAESAGFDTSKPDWEDKFTTYVRNLTGL